MQYIFGIGKEIASSCRLGTSAACAGWRCVSRPAEMMSGNKADGKSNSGSYFSTIFGSSFDQMSKPGAAKALESNPNDIPKEELLQLCMKLNKRMQALESKHSDLIAKYKSLSQERTILLDVIRNSLTVPVAENDDISTVIEIWRHQCEEERSYLRKLEEEVRLSKSLQSEPLMATEQDEVRILHA